MYLSKGSVVSGDAGHNCYPDYGENDIVSEDENTKQIWSYVKKYLNELGIEVVDCTPWGENFNYIGESQKYRVIKANESKSKVHLSIHLNSGIGNGVECWVGKNHDNAKKIANRICKEISNLGFKNRGVKECDIYLVNYTLMPSIIINCYFCDSKIDSILICNDKIARAIINGLIGRVI